MAVFSLEEMKTSNYRGVLNKKRLDPAKTSAIQRACLAEFPAKQQESTRSMNKDIREGIDEMCRRCVRKEKLNLQ